MLWVLKILGHFYWISFNLLMKSIIRVRPVLMEFSMNFRHFVIFPVFSVLFLLLLFIVYIYLRKQNTKNDSKMPLYKCTTPKYCLVTLHKQESSDSSRSSGKHRDFHLKVIYGQKNSKKRAGMCISIWTSYIILGNI